MTRILPIECMNTRSYNFASKGRGKRGLAGQRMRRLENDLAVRLGVGRKLYNAVEHLVELGVIGLERQLLGHKVDGHGFDALELGQLVLKLARTVGAVDLVEFKLLFMVGSFPCFAAWVQAALVPWLVAIRRYGSCPG